MVTVTMVVSAILVAGCSEQSNAPKRDEAGSQKPKTVVVNKGMSKEEEKKLNERLAELEEKVGDQSPEQPPTQDTESTEDAARAAAQGYYGAAAAGNYNYTYNELSSYALSQFTEDEWVAANTALASDEASYSIESVTMVDGSTAEVHLTVTLPDGSSFGRTTLFVLENGSWKHELTQEEYDLFASATETAAPATDSATEPASPNANANTKHVKIVISSNKPADVSIYDDSFNWAVNEEIVGTKTYERDIPENSGLSVTAITAAFNAQTTIQVYEDGSLVTQDSDSHGNAIVTY
jgi:hypothetical protein